MLTILKYVIGVILGWGLNAIFGPAGILGLTPLAIISAVTNSNGAIYTALAKEFGDETDVGAIAILSFNDGPFLTMIALGATGLADIPFISLVAAIVPLIIGMILGNLDPDFRKLLSDGMAMLLPFNGFVLGSNTSLFTIAEAGVGGIALGIMTLFFTGVLLTIFTALSGASPTPWVWLSERPQAMRWRCRPPWLWLTRAWSPLFPWRRPRLQAQWLSPLFSARFSRECLPGWQRKSRQR